MAEKADTRMASIQSVSQFLCTVRYFRSQQIAGQICSRLKPLIEKPENFYSQRVHEFKGCIWSPRQNFLAPGSQNNSPSDILEGRFSFLNSKQDIGWPPDWSCNNLPKLWLYNLLYFEYLWCLDYSKSKTLVLDWIENYPLRRKRVGWEPYPISLRLMNLCSVFFSKYRKQTEDDTFFLKKLWSSIFIQTEWLAKHLERHLLGNHLFENAAALAFVGSCFEGPAAKKWLDIGINILQKEIPEQILADGMHFELSPMYHCRVLYLLAMLANTANEQLVSIVAEPLRRMAKAMKRLCHPDGQIALLNDSAFGIYNEPQQLLLYCSQLPSESELRTLSDIGSFALPDAGYYGYRSNDGIFIICDAGRLGPDYIPGHGHADTFSFELSLNGHRVIVDSGVYDYEVSSTRKYCRSTRAHNTIEIEGRDQCEMWGAFRVARRGRPHDVKWLPDKNGGFQLGGWHDGYKRLKGKPIHYREFIWDGRHKLVVTDKITASCSQNMISKLHLHPDCSVSALEDNSVLINYPAGKSKISFFGNGQLTIEKSFYCPEFGIRDTNTVLKFSFSGQRIRTGFKIEVL